MRKLQLIPKHLVTWGMLCCLLLNTAWLPSAGNEKNPNPKKESKLVAGPPVFTDPIPEDITVSCIDDVPAPVSLTATDDNDPSYPKQVVSVDTPPAASLNACSNGTITRRWTTTDTGGDNLTVEATQIITIQADVTGPSFDLTGIGSLNKTVSCEASKSGAPNSPDRYDNWISSLRTALPTRLDDNCSGVDTFTDDAPASYELDCGTLTVTFTATDVCGWSSDLQVTYTVIDTVAPTLSGVPADIQISCDDPIPVLPPLLQPTIVLLA